MSLQIKKATVCPSCWHRYVQKWRSGSDKATEQPEWSPAGTRRTNRTEDLWGVQPDVMHDVKLTDWPQHPDLSSTSWWSRAEAHLPAWHPSDWSSSFIPPPWSVFWSGPQILEWRIESTLRRWAGGRTGTHTGHYWKWWGSHLTSSPWFLQLHSGISSRTCGKHHIVRRVVEAGRAASFSTSSWSCCLSCLQPFQPGSGCELCRLLADTSFMHHRLPSLWFQCRKSAVSPDQTEMCLTGSEVVCGCSWRPREDVGGGGCRITGGQSNTLHHICKSALLG